jgi:selenocysteine lyase/cysteine desulfurase
MPSFDLTWIRSQFPSLSQTVNGHPAVFLDGPGRTQVPQRVIVGVSSYCRDSYANTHGAGATALRAEQMLAEADAAPR